MNNFFNLIENVKYVLKRWYITLLIPVFVSVGMFFLIDNYQQTKDQYTATASFVLAVKDSKKMKTQAGLVGQNYSEALMGTMVSLVKNNRTITHTLGEVDGVDEYTPEQLQYIMVPRVRNSITVSPENMICYISYKDSSAKRAKNMVNNLLKQTKKSEKELWGTEAVKILNTAVTPLHKDSHSRVTNLIVMCTFVVSFLMASAGILIRRYI